ncbi:type II secretion protein N [Psychromonas marina]|uniref:Type II secretion system protein N n=1 Tax=Psychromonas marina TaxID=88364 RepID=A0ABQ6E0U9_9GAMM|nr:type II secretion system protein N [Psychromonas marina]GLS90631.1 type II secretion protein N [Psychromonas marina]
MKLKISLAFFVLYILSLLFTVPATLVTRIIPENTGIEIGHVTGTVWNAKLSEVNYQNQFQLKTLTWDFDWSALLALQLKADVKFNNGRNQLNGTGSAIYSASGLAVDDLKVNMQATELLPYLALPVPVTPSGKFTLVIEHASQGAPYCNELDGYLVWQGANVETPMGNIDLASPNVDLSCKEGGVVASLKQQSEQLTTNAEVKLSEGGRYQLKGDIKGTDQLDPTILQALSWIGPKTKTGATLLSFKGRL